MGRYTKNKIQINKFKADNQMNMLHGTCFFVLKQEKIKSRIELEITLIYVAGGDAQVTIFVIIIFKSTSPHI